jgi:hypothetical protein
MLPENLKKKFKPKNKVFTFVTNTLFSLISLELSTGTKGKL